MNRKIETLANEFDCNFVPPRRFSPPAKMVIYDYHEVELPKLKGTFSQLNFTYNITQRYLPKLVEPEFDANLSIEINNPNNKTLEISLETMRSSMQKLFGKTDVEFEDHRFDDNFLVKSNDLDFTYKVMTDEIRRQAFQNISAFSGKLAFGNISSKSHGSQNKAGAEKLSDKILDIEMISDSPSEPESKIPLNQVKLQSKLKYDSFGFVPLSDANYRRTLSMMKLLFNIAKNIKSNL